MKRIFSGVQPTGKLHIGNYLGAIKNWVSQSKDNESFFCIVDLHAITIKKDPKILREDILQTAAFYLATGLDPKRSTIFIQSQVPAHSQLTWILNCVCPIGWLKRMIQFKEKSKGKDKENISVGLFDYPVLMASDILLYDTDLVPIGKDQLQHLELTIDLAQRFNKIFGKTFKIPKPLISKETAKIMSLTDLTKKMSKSDKNPNSCIYLADFPDVIREKIQKATTDSQKEIVFDKKRPAIFNLLTIYKGISEKTEKEIEEEFKNKGYFEFKKILAETLINFLKPIQEKQKELLNNKDYLEKVLKEGKEKAIEISEKKLNEVKEKVGFLL